MAERFERQIPVVTGGFTNPTVEYTDANTISFRCFYNGYDNKSDSWHWYLDRRTGEFYN